MRNYPGHNERTALEADRNALAAIDASVRFARARTLRAEAELQRHCWQENPDAPVDRAYAAREFLRAAAIRRARKHAEIAEYDVELIESDAFDDSAD